MPRIKLTTELTALINHFAAHHGYPQRIKAVDIWREVSHEHDVSLRTVQRCLAEFRQLGRAEPKRHTKGMSIRRRCRTPETIAQVRALVVSPNNHAHNHKSPREVVSLMRARGIRTSLTTVRRIIKDDLHFKNVRRMNVHTLTLQQKQNRVEKCRAWRVRHRVNWMRFVHSDEKVRIGVCYEGMRMCAYSISMRVRARVDTMIDCTFTNAYANVPSTLYVYTNRAANGARR
jgi:Fe2+ or Zn2+ uptake regulation protein